MSVFMLQQAFACKSYLFYLCANVPPAQLGRGACMSAATDLQNPDFRTQGRAKDPSFWTEPQESQWQSPGRMEQRLPGHSDQ